MLQRGCRVCSGKESCKHIFFGGTSQKYNSSAAWEDAAGATAFLECASRGRCDSAAPGSNVEDPQVILPDIEGCGWHYSSPALRLFSGEFMLLLLRASGGDFFGGASSPHRFFPRRIGRWHRMNSRSGKKGAYAAKQSFLFWPGTRFSPIVTVGPTGHGESCLNTTIDYGPTRLMRSMSTICTINYIYIGMSCYI